MEALRISFGTRIRDSKQITDLINYKFATLGQFYPECQTDEATELHIEKDVFHFRFFSSYEIYERINKLESSKPSIPNKIPVWAIKNSAVIIGHQLAHIFNEVIKDILSKN